MHDGKFLHTLQLSEAAKAIWILLLSTQQQKQPSLDHDVELLSPEGKVLTLAAKDPERMACCRQMDRSTFNFMQQELRNKTSNAQVGTSIHQPGLSRSRAANESVYLFRKDANMCVDACVLAACMQTCLFSLFVTCQPACLPADLSVCVPACMHASNPSRLQLHMRFDMHIDIHLHILHVHLHLHADAWICAPSVTTYAYMYSHIYVHVHMYVCYVEYCAAQNRNAT